MYPRSGGDTQNTEWANETNEDFTRGEYPVYAGTPELGGRRGSRPRCPLSGGARGAKAPFQFKGLPWRNSELSEMLVQFFYEFASENARNAVIELQEVAQSPGGEPPHTSIIQ
jgi:hypothetical protein